MRFENRVALVTGGGRGIGRATALRLAKEGADIVISDINGGGAASVAEAVRALGRQALVVEADVADEADSERMVAEAQAAFGHVDVVFANAGIINAQTVADMPVSAWDEVIRVNLRGIFLTCKHVTQALIAAGGGAIVNMSSSTAGWDTLPDGAAYMASKEAVSGLTKSLALQLGGHGIRVNAVCPGIIQTQLSWSEGMTESVWEARHEAFARRIPLRRVGQPDDVAAAVAFLASDDARHITGSLLLIDGGQTLQSWSNAPDADAYPLHRSRSESRNTGDG